MSHQFVLAGLLFMYCLPSFIAFLNKNRQLPAIQLLNFFLGWTVIGWIIAMIWAVAKPQPQTVIIHQASPPR